MVSNVVEIYQESISNEILVLENGLFSSPVYGIYTCRERFGNVFLKISDDITAKIFYHHYLQLIIIDSFNHRNLPLNKANSSILK